MIPFTILFEKDEDEELKMKHVGSGYGKLIGGSIGSVPGAVVGHYIGKDAPQKPEAPADVSRAGHRVPILVDKKLGMRQVKAGGLGAMIGAGVGAALSAAAGGDPEDNAATATGGAALGGATGFTGSSLRAGYQTARKMGYGRFGSTVAGVTPLAGLTTPKALRQKMLADKKPVAAAA